MDCGQGKRVTRIGEKQTICSSAFQTRASKSSYPLLRLCAPVSDECGRTADVQAYILPCGKGLGFMVYTYQFAYSGLARR